METTTISMKERNERIISEANNLAAIADYKHYEFLIDQMLLDFLDGEVEKKQEAYLFVLNLKRLLKASNDNFMKIRKENYHEIKRLEDKRMETVFTG